MTMTFCFSNLCCICLDERENLKKIVIADLCSSEILVKLKNCSFVVDWTRKKLDLLICEKCYINLHLAHEFIEMCRENSILFESYTAQLEHFKQPDENTEVVFSSTIEDIKNANINSNKYKTISENLPVQTISSVEYISRAPSINNNTPVKQILNPIQYISLPATQYDQFIIQNSKLQAVNGDFAKFQVKEEPTNQEITEEPTSNEDYEQILKPEVKEENICDSNEETMDDLTIYNEDTNEYLDDTIYGNSNNTEEESIEHSDTDEGAHKCMFCNKTFAFKSNLKTHMLRHTGEKPFKCSVCGKEFNRKSNVNVHMLIHARVKSHKCDVCHKRFTKKSHLDEHMSCHTGNKPFECNVCGNQFTRKSSLNGHMLIHAGIKSYECSVCNWRFTQKAHLNRHLLTHNGYNRKNKKKIRRLNCPTAEQTQ